MGLKDTERTWIWHALTSVESLSTCCSGGPNPWKLTDHLPKLSPNSQHTHSTTQPGPRLKSGPDVTTTYLATPSPRCWQGLLLPLLPGLSVRAAGVSTAGLSAGLHSAPLWRTKGLDASGEGRRLRAGLLFPSWTSLGAGRREGGGSGLGPLRDVCSW